MQSQGGGRIINIIGSAGRQPNAAYLAGGGANAALMNLTKALADEGAPHRILVNGINPGPIRTERWDMMMTRMAAERGQTPGEIEAEWMRDNPLQRPGEPQEVAALAVFLASARASYITGALIRSTVERPDAFNNTASALDPSPVVSAPHAGDYCGGGHAGLSRATPASPARPHRAGRRQLPGDDGWPGQCQSDQWTRLADCGFWADGLE